MLPNITAAPFQLDAPMQALADALAAGPEANWIGQTFLKWDYNEIAVLREGIVAAGLGGA